MRRFVIATEIATPVPRVWRALCDPAQVPRWDTGVTSAMNPPADYPRPGQTVRWQYRSRHWPTLIDLPQEVVPQQKLRSILELGPFYIDETYDLTPSQIGTLVTTTLELTIRRPVIGRLLERLWPGREVRTGFEASLHGLKRYCEDDAPA